MKRVEAWRTLHEMGGDATQKQKEALGVAMDDIEFVDLMRGHGVPLTNAQHIRSMTDEELAKWLDEDIGCCCYCSEDARLENEPLLRGEKCDEQCKKHLLYWLKQPYKEEV